MVTDDEKTIGRRLRALRERAGLSQAQLAAKVSEHGVPGIYPQTILKLESGARSLKYGEAVALCRVLGVQLDALASEPVTLPKIDQLAMSVVTNLERKVRELHVAHLEVDVIRANLRQTLDEGLSPAVEQRVRDALEVSGG